MRRGYKTAANRTKVPWYWQLVAQLVNLGLKVPSVEVANKLHNKLSKLMEENPEWPWPYDLEGTQFPTGFTLVGNHARTESHEKWQASLCDDHQDDIIIPLSELMDDDEMVQIYRLCFKGTEEELIERLDQPNFKVMYEDPHQ